MASSVDQGNLNPVEMAGKQTVGESDPTIVNRTRNALGDIGNRLIKNGATATNARRKNRLGQLLPNMSNLTKKPTDVAGKSTAAIAKVTGVIRSTSNVSSKPSGALMPQRQRIAGTGVTRSQSFGVRSKVISKSQPTLVKVEEKDIGGTKQRVQFCQKPSSKGSVKVEPTIAEKDETKPSTSTSRAVATASVERDLNSIIGEIKAFSIERYGNGFPDIDAKDTGPFMLKEYVKDITEYLFNHEKLFMIPADFLNSRHVTARMRTVLLDWLVEVHQQFGFCAETLFITGKLLDRYLLLDPTVSRTRLQLVGVTSLYLASKFEEVQTPTMVDFATVSDNAFTSSDVKEMEKKMLTALKFDFSAPQPVFFLRRFSKAASANVVVHNVAKYLMELALVDYSVCHYFPSQIAAGSLGLSLMIMENKPLVEMWNPVVVHYTKNSLSDLKPLLLLLVQTLSRVYEDPTKFQAVRTKFSNKKVFRVSTIPQIQVSVWKSRVLAELNTL